MNKNIIRLQQEKKPALFFCLIMDAIGCATYLFPIWGEWGDLLWAPVSAYVFYRTFSGKVGKVGSFINLIEEALPFLDFIPTFTLGYLYVRFRGEKARFDSN